MKKLTKDELDMLDHEEKKYKYHTRNSKSYSVQLAVGTVQAVNGLMTLTEREHHEMQELLASRRPDLAQNISFIDEEAAKEVAKKVMLERKAQAARGMTHTMNNTEAQKPAFIKELQVSIPPGMTEGKGQALAGSAEAIKAAAAEFKPIEMSEFSTAQVAADDTKSENSALAALRERVKHS